MKHKTPDGYRKLQRNEVIQEGDIMASGEKVLGSIGEHYNPTRHVNGRFRKIDVSKFKAYDKVQVRLEDETWDDEIGVVDGVYTDRNGKECIVIKWPSEKDLHIYFADENLRHAVEPLIVAGLLPVTKVDSSTVKVGCTKITKTEAKKIMQLMKW